MMNVIILKTRIKGGVHYEVVVDGTTKSVWGEMSQANYAAKQYKKRIEQINKPRDSSAKNERP